jgi:phenylpropionate dioxygenase-like ring-hydroxylating dioxygenase large terminal subunit
MADLEARLTAPQAKGHVSVARLGGAWYVACRSRELRRRPLARTLLGIPIVLFRDASGAASALLDRCPHRNVPLSLGRVAGSGRLECGYHGWQFDGGGRCRLVPGLTADAAPSAALDPVLTDGAAEGCAPGSQGRRVAAFATRERSGLVWVFATPDVETIGEPFELPQASAPGYTTVVRELDMDCTLHAAMENALDVPHTAFLHRGLFRGGAPRNEIRAVVRRRGKLVEAEYLGEPRPPGLAARLLSPSGGVVEHWDRFLLPSIAQVEYRLGAENHLLVTSICTPLEDFRTRMFAVVSFRLRLPGALIRPLLQPLAMRIFRQDAALLARQSDVIRRFGGESFVSTDLDLLGPHIWRLLKQAEAGIAPDPGEEVLREVRFWA